MKYKEIKGDWKRLKYKEYEVWGDEIIRIMMYEVIKGDESMSMKEIKGD
jgi:hypothetical protein